MRLASVAASLGQRPGLVDDNGVNLFHRLQHLGVLDQHAVLRSPSDADHDRHRRGQAQAQGQAMIKTATALTRA